MHNPNQPTSWRYDGSISYVSHSDDSPLLSEHKQSDSSGLMSAWLELWPCQSGSSDDKQRTQDPHNFNQGNQSEAMHMRVKFQAKEIGHQLPTPLPCGSTQTLREHQSCILSKTFILHLNLGCPGTWSCGLVYSTQFRKSYKMSHREKQQQGQCIKPQISFLDISSYRLEQGVFSRVYELASGCDSLADMFFFSCSSNVFLKISTISLLGTPFLGLLEAIQTTKTTTKHRARKLKPT